MVFGFGQAVLINADFTRQWSSRQQAVRQLVGRIGGSSRGKWLSCQSSVIDTLLLPTPREPHWPPLSRELSCMRRSPCAWNLEGCSRRPDRDTKWQGFRLSARCHSPGPLNSRRGWTPTGASLQGWPQCVTAIIFSLHTISNWEGLETAGGVLKSGFLGVFTPCWPTVCR